MSSKFIKFLKDRFKNGFSWEDLAFLSVLIIIFWTCVILNSAVTLQAQMPIYLIILIPLEVILLIQIAEYSIVLCL